MKKLPKKRELTKAVKTQAKRKELTPVVKAQPERKGLTAAVKTQPKRKGVTAAVKTQPKRKELTPVVKVQPQKRDISPEDLGKRYKCYKCGTKFFDLGRLQPLCPSCGEDQNNEETKRMLKRKKKRRSAYVGKTDHNISVPEERADLIEVVKEVENDYVLDMDDIVLEEYADTE